MTRRSLVIIVLLLGAVGAGGVWWWATSRGASTTAAAGEREVEYYTCSMHPYLREPEPGNCPSCGMKLQPVYKGGATGEGSDGTIHVSAEEQRLLGIRTIRVGRAAGGHSIRTVGRIEVNTERVHHVHTRMRGWVERVHVGALEVMVRSGQPLLEIYAPEIVSTQEEYLLALRSVDVLGPDADPFAREGAEKLRDAARDRLRQWNVPATTIAAIERTREVERTYTLRAPITGYIQRIQAVHGDQVDPSTVLYQIADISEVWLIAEIYEQDISSVRTGQRVTATVAGLPGRTFTGVITYIYPTIESSTRTNRVRVSIANPDYALKPGMFADLTIEVGSGGEAATGDTRPRLAVPIDAVLVTGTRNLVFREHAPGIFEPVEVTLGAARGGVYEVMAGLREGDTIVERGAFFLDSESQLRGLGGSAGANPHAGHGAAVPAATPTTSAPARAPADPHAGHAGH